MTKPFSPKLLTAHVRALLRRGLNQPKPPAAVKPAKDASAKILAVKTLGSCELRIADRRLSWAAEFSPAQRQLMSTLVAAKDGKLSQEWVQAALWPESSPTRARSSFDSLLSRVRRTLEEALAPFDSKKYLVVKRGYLCLENARIDAHEFLRLVRKGSQQVNAGELWPAEITFSSAFSLWQGTFIPGDFGSDSAAVFQDELEQVFLESSQTFARLLAENGRYPQAAKLLRDALRYNPTADSVVRLLYQLCLVQGAPGQAGQVINQYCEALSREQFSEQERQEAIRDFPTGPPARGWLSGSGRKNVKKAIIFSDKAAVVRNL